jgi:hypothetical protein
MNFGIVLVLISIVTIIITVILNLLFKKKRYVKYIPTIILFPFIVYNFITMYSVTTESFQSLGRFVMGVLLLVPCASSLIVSFAFDISHKFWKR